ncbi:MAG: SpoIIE family protein phosphatase [Bacteroidetes bacterium]|nr:SpoIIE family protein phosphatase [Bacteroidota bacterium]
MNLNQFIEKLVYKEELKTSELKRKGVFFQSTLLLFAIINVALTVYMAPKVPKEQTLLFISKMTFVTFAILALITVYKYFGKRILLVNTMGLIVGMGVLDTYQYSGGIYSPDMIWYMIALPAWFLLVGNKPTFYVWFTFGVITALFYVYADINHFRDFFNESPRSGTYIFMNIFFASGMVFVILLINESNVEKSRNEVILAKAELELKSIQLENKNEDIVSSINYAKRIQYAILPHEESLAKILPLAFILYKPKDIVSGDFYWLHELDRDNYVLACADCTGHGVPGAFMTVIGSNSLSQIVAENKITQPAQILQELDKKITFTLKQDKSRTAMVQDGMDLALIKVDKHKKELVYASAKRSAILIRNNQIQEFKGSKLSLGGMQSGDKHFEEVKIKLEEDDMVYLFTDGYIDQFGGPSNKKFMIKQFRDLLLSIHHLSLQEQRSKLDNAIEQWKGPGLQTDDMLVIGIRF